MSVLTSVRFRSYNRSSLPQDDEVVLEFDRRGYWSEMNLHHFRPFPFIICRHLRYLKSQSIIWSSPFTSLIILPDKEHYYYSFHSIHYSPIWLCISSLNACEIDQRESYIDRSICIHFIVINFVNVFPSHSFVRFGGSKNMWTNGKRTRARVSLTQNE